MYAVAGSNPKPWNSPSDLEFPGPMADHTRGTIIKKGLEKFYESIHGARILPTAPTFNSETGVQVSCQDKNVCSEIFENSIIYLMQNLRIGKSDCLTFFDSGANSHLIDGQLAEKDKLQLISSNSLGSIWRWICHDGVWYLQVQFGTRRRQEISRDHSSRDEE